MSVMRCGCGRTVDLDVRDEDWDSDRDECAACAEEQLKQQAAQQASDDDFLTGQ